MSNAATQQPENLSRRANRDAPGRTNPAQACQAVRILGARMPLPIRTGAYAYSAGNTADLASGFGIDDLQALDAPHLIPRGSVIVSVWHSQVSYCDVGVTHAEVGRYQ